MIQIAAPLIGTLIGLTSFVIAFFSPIWAWLPLGVADAFLLYVLIGTRLVEIEGISGLSPEADRMLQKYSHFYAMPLSSELYSSSASLLQFAGIPVALVGVFQGFWWGVAICIVNYFIMDLTAAKFNPTFFLRDPVKIAAHLEVLSHIRRYTEHQEQTSENVP